MSKNEDAIGTASLEADGTIVLHLKAEGTNGETGDAILRYPPSHPDFNMIKEHVGEIPTGGTVMVKPFPD